MMQKHWLGRSAGRVVDVNALQRSALWLALHQITPLALLPHVTPSAMK
jgi:hypothetical protein